MSNAQPRITICIPHWQVKDYMTACLRSIRKHSQKYNLEVIVVDNGSKDDSLDYLRSLDWIRLIERPDEIHTNWPENVFTAWDRGLKEATGQFYVTMHSDVFVKSDDWLDPFLREMNYDPSVVASGAWKLVHEHPLYTAQKKVFGYLNGTFKKFLGRKPGVVWKQQPYPRDYCAMYRRDVLLQHNLSFVCIDHRGGGYSIATQIWHEGYRTGVFDVEEMGRNVFHVAHGTAAVADEKPLNHRRAQKKVEKKVSNLFDEQWIKQLLADDSLDNSTIDTARIAA